MDGTKRTVGACRLATVVMLLAGTLVIGAPSASGAAEGAPSDSRATFFGGQNVDSCADIGLGDDEELYADGVEDLVPKTTADANISVTEKLNAGSVQAGQGTEINVTLLNDDVLIEAIVVKGGPAYNKYTLPQYLPPVLDPDQHYISPLNEGGKVPDISHWFVCYRIAEDVPPGSLVVSKVVVPPVAAGVVLPTSYTAEVTCNDGTEETVTLPAGGGEGTPVVEDVTAGSTCTVVETTTLPAGSTVTYNPAGVDTAGITIESEEEASVTITNDFSAVLGAAAAQAVELAPNFTG